MIDIVTISIGIVALALAILVYRKLTQQWVEWSNAKNCAKRGVPYSPVKTASMWDLIYGCRHHLLIDAEFKRLGKVFGFDTGDHSTTIIIGEPEMLQQILSKDFASFVNRRNMPQVGLITKMLFFTEDEDWKRLRSIVTPTFSTGKMKLMKPRIDETLKNMLHNFDSAIAKNKVVDIKHLAGAYTLDAIAKTVFGVTIDSLNDADNPLAENAREVFINEFQWSFVLLALLQHYIPPLHSLINKVKTWITGPRGTGVFLEVSVKIIEQKKKEFAVRKNEGTVRKAADFIELMLEAEEEGELSLRENKDKSSKFITQDEMLAQGVLFFLAGYDTTTNTITMTCYNLALHPEIQDKLYHEIEDVLKKLATETNTEDPFELVTLETLSRFEYLNAVIDEAMRIHPPSLYFERRAGSDICLQTTDGKTQVEVKKGDVIQIPTWSVHHDPDNFKDPYVFQPERFVGEPKHHKYAHIPFGSGPRMCVARRLALLEANLAVLHLIRKFRLSVCSQTPVPPNFYSLQNNLLSPRGLMIKCEPRL